MAVHSEGPRVIGLSPFLSLSREQKSSITENWASSCNRGGSIHDGLFKYVVYKQPLSLDRFLIHDVTQEDGQANNLKNAFVLVCLNRFQQIYTVHSFQAANEAVRATWLFKLRDTIDRWKRTLQNTVFRSHRPSGSGASGGSSNGTKKAPPAGGGGGGKANVADKT